MICVPLQISAREFILFVVLEDDNLRRLKCYDPGCVELGKMGKPWSGLQLTEFHICYATPEQARRLGSSLSGQDALEFIRRELFKNWQFRPEQGDNDGRYQSPTKQ